MTAQTLKAAAVSTYTKAQEVSAQAVVFTVANVLMFIAEILSILPQFPGLDPSALPYIAFAQLVFNLFVRHFFSGQDENKPTS